MSFFASRAFQQKRRKEEKFQEKEDLFEDRTERKQEYEYMFGEKQAKPKGSDKLEALFILEYKMFELDKRVLFLENKIKSDEEEIKTKVDKPTPVEKAKKESDSHKFFKEIFGRLNVVEKSHKTLWDHVHG